MDEVTGAQLIAEALKSQSVVVVCFFSGFSCIF